MQDFLELKNVSLKFPNKNSLIVNNINLKVTQGEFVCLLGPSGCGKSSLLSLIAGFNKPNQGYINFKNQKIKRPSLERTMVFQEYALFPWLNVIQNVAFGLKKQIKNRDERYLLASRYLKIVGLLDHARDKVNQLSGGMKQRVAIARALAVKPELLLMDEPFGALDDKTRKDMQALLIEIWQELKCSIIFVTHSIDEALLLADRVIVLESDYQNKNLKGSLKADIFIDQDRPRDLDNLSDKKVEISLLLR